MQCEKRGDHVEEEGGSCAQDFMEGNLWSMDSEQGKKGTNLVVVTLQLLVGHMGMHICTCTCTCMYMYKAVGVDTHIRHVHVAGYRFLCKFLLL